MSALLDRILDTFPATDDTGVPLRSVITITLSGLNYDEDSLTEGFFLEGADTDQFVGPSMVSLKFPDNVSQNDFDDFFESPGRKGIAKGVVTTSGIAGNIVLSFTPTLPLAATVDYIANLTGVLELDGITEVSGFVSIPFTTGSGSIEEIPTETSSSVLSLAATTVTSSTDLAISNTSPIDHSIENDIELEEIMVEFNKDLDPTSISAENIIVESVPAVDHPNLSVTSSENIAKQIEIIGNFLKIKI